MSGVSFTLSLVDKITGPAKSVVGSFGSVAQQAKTLQTAMTSLEKQMTKASALGDTAKVEQLSQKYNQFGGALKELGPEAEGASSQTAGLGESLAEVAGPASIAAAAIGAVVVAAVGLTLKGAALALEMGELRDKTLATFSALAGGDAAGAATLTMVDGLRSKLGLTRAELVPMTNELLAMGVKSQDVAAQLTALATVKAVGIDGGTEEYTTILKKLSAQTKVSSKDLTGLYKTGVNVSQVAEAMGVSVTQLQTGLKNGSVSAKDFGAALTQAVTAKGAGALANQANSLSAQWANLKESFGQLFEGVDAGPFLAQLKGLFAIFGQNTASGKAMKSAITGFFNGLFALAAKVIPYVKTGFELLVIGALKLFIFLKPLVTWLTKMWQTHDGIGILQKALIGVGIVVAALAAPFVISAAMAVAFVAAVVAIGAGLAVAIGAIASFVVNAVSTLMGWVSSGEKLAGDFIAGLVSGITGGAANVLKTVENLGSSMLGSIKGVLGIHSPSVEMMKLGGHTATGFAQGIQGGAGDVAGAASGLGSAAMGGIPAPSGGASAGGGGGAGGNSVSITVNVGGGGKGDDAQKTGQTIADIVEDKLTLVFEKFALTQGLGANA